MPLDTRMISNAMQAWPKAPDVLGSLQTGLTQGYERQTAQQQQQLNQLKMAEAQRAEQERGTLARAFQGAVTTDPVTGQTTLDMPKAFSTAYRTSTNPLAVLKAETEYGKGQAESRKATLEARKTQLETLQKQTEYVSGLANGVLAVEAQGGDVEQAYQAAMQQAAQVLGPDQIRGVPPTYDRSVVTRFAMSGLKSSEALQAQQKVIDQQLEEHRIALQRQQEERLRRGEGREERRLGLEEEKARRAGREAARQVPQYTSDSTLNVAIDRHMQARGLTGSPPGDVLAQAQQDVEDGKVRVSASTGTSQIVQTPEGYARVNPRTGAVEMVTSPTGTPLQPKPTTEEERAASYATGVSQAHDTATALENKGVSTTSGTQLAQKLPFNLGNYLLPAEQQQYQQAILQFAQNLLRKESGANITQGEYEMTNKTYFPQPGDGPEVIKQKQEARKAVVERIQREGTRATPAGGSRQGGGARPHASIPVEQMTPQQLDEVEAWIRQQQQQRR